MANKTVVDKKLASKKRATKERGERIYVTLDKRRTSQLAQMLKAFGGDNSSAVADCIARRHIELKKEYPNEFD